jgi:hypothetical protein
MAAVEEAGRILRSRVYARIGLLGNPSDAFNGSCISFSLANFHAEVRWAAKTCAHGLQHQHMGAIKRICGSGGVTLRPCGACRRPPPYAHSTVCRRSQVTLTPSPTLRFLPNPECDASEFDSLRSLTRHLRGWGFNGGMRLLQAMCKRFYEHCRARDIPLPAEAGNFTLSYITTIPRQVTLLRRTARQLTQSAHHCMCPPPLLWPPQPCAPTRATHPSDCNCNPMHTHCNCNFNVQCGLSGSSAIACATLNCLLRHYRLEEAVPVAVRPALVLGAEEELGIAAGLQDRVVQVRPGQSCCMWPGLAGLGWLPARPGHAGRHGCACREMQGRLAGPA